MPKFRSTEASLYNGISQQSPELRLDSQVTDANNVNLTLARGVEMRPPTEIITSESGQFSADTLVHPINSTSSQTYILAIAGDGSTIASKIYDTAGNSYQIEYQDASAQQYLETDDGSGVFNPTQALQLSSVLDYTFACNKNVTPAMSSTALPDLAEAGYVWIKNGVQQVERSIYVNGTKITDAKDTVNDSSNILDYFQANLPAGFTYSRVSDAVLKIYRVDGAAFTLTATDTYSDTTMAASLTSGVVIEDLPPVATDEEIMKIVPEENSDAAYYLQYNAGTKSWSEVSAPGEPDEFDSTTMPHAFVRMTDDAIGTITGTPFYTYFSFERLEWVARTSGGNESSPVPSFIGTPIRDTFFFKNRLGFIAGDNVILSATGDIFRFWPTTVKEVLDDDPIDTPVSSTRDVTLQHVAQFPESLILVGDTEQFTLGSGGKSFTPENAVLDPTTSYPASGTVPPIAVGSTLYFVSPQSSYAAIREYSVQPETLVTDAADITAHVPRLLENTVKKLISENSLEYLFIINTDEYDEDGNQMLVYKFYWQGNEKVQSAWIRWSFWFNPIGGATLNGKLYLLGTEMVGGAAQTILVSVNLSDKPPVILDDANSPYKSTRPYIDRLTTVEATPTTIGDSIIIQVTAEQYAYPTIDDATTVVVDRVTGVKYSYITRYEDGGNYYLVLGNPDFLISEDLEFDDTILGSYILGGEALDPAPAFPYILPLTFTS